MYLTQDLILTTGLSLLQYPVVRTTTDRVDVEVIGPAEALDLETECFGINNLAAQEKMFHYEDESLSYSSYTFADGR